MVLFPYSFSVFPCFLLPFSPLSTAASFPTSLSWSNEAFTSANFPLASRFWSKSKCISMGFSITHRWLVLSKFNFSKNSYKLIARWLRWKNKLGTEDLFSTANEIYLFSAFVYLPVCRSPFECHSNFAAIAWDMFGKICARLKTTLSLLVKCCVRLPPATLCRHCSCACQLVRW